MTWFSRLRNQTPGPAEDRPPAIDDTDSPEALRAMLVRTNRFINQNSGHLPGEAVVNARRMTDVLREIIDTSAVRPLDVYAVISIKATLEDYLPTTLQRYLAVDHDLLHAPRASGRTPVQSLLEQIDALSLSAGLVLDGARNQDVDALLTQGNFLRTKFTASDLDL